MLSAWIRDQFPTQCSLNNLNWFGDWFISLREITWLNPWSDRANAWSLQIFFGMENKNHCVRVKLFVRKTKSHELWKLELYDLASIAIHSSGVATTSQLEFFLNDKNESSSSFRSIFWNWINWFCSVPLTASAHVDAILYQFIRSHK